MTRLLSLREARERAGWTQARLAQAVGIVAPVLSNAENGVGQLTLPNMIRIEQALGKSIDWADDIVQHDKEVALHLIVNLAERFPLTQVLAFALKHIASDARAGDAVATLSFYSQAAGIVETATLLPPEVQRRTR